MNKLLLALLMSFTLLISACGGGSGNGFGDQGTDTGIDGGVDPDVDPDDPDIDDDTDVDPSVVLAMGNGTGGLFQAGVLSVPAAALSSGGDGAVNLTIVDSADGSPFTAGNVVVTFSSTCINAGSATIENPTATQTGVVSVIYDALANGEGPVLCQGDDVITASATIDGQTITATGTITVAAPQVGTIEFVSSLPSAISLKGSGGTEQSKVTFKVLDAGGNPFPAGLLVNFEVKPVVGGIALQEASDNTDALGEVEAIVLAGTAKATVKVSATVDLSPTITTTSDNLVITAGLAHQNGLVLAAEEFNKASFGRLNVVYPLTVQVADRFGNSVPDNTEISFTAEKGIVDTSCTTTDGSCTVNWRTGTDVPGYTPGDPRPGRAQILATVQGEESFTDRNGDGLFNDVTAPADTWDNLSEPYRDDNSTGAYESGEYFLDGGGDLTYNVVNDTDNGSATPQFNGLLCDRGNSAPFIDDCSAVTSVGIFREITLIQSYPDGGAFITYVPDDDAEAARAIAQPGYVPVSCVKGDNPNTPAVVETNWAMDCPSLSGASIYVPAGGVYFLEACISDVNSNPMPAGAEVSMPDLTNGKVLGDKESDYPITTEPACTQFALVSDDDDTTSGTAVVKIESDLPGGGSVSSSAVFSLLDVDPDA